MPLAEPLASAIAAIEAHDVEGLALALTRAPDIVGRPVGDNENHLLDMAAATCDERTVALLLERGADPAATNVHGWTALHQAAYVGLPPLARLLLDAGAPLVFVPGPLDQDMVRALVNELGERRLTVIGAPGSPSLARLEELGVARVSYGPMPQRVALTALQELVEEVGRGGGVPSTMRPLN